MDGAWQVHEAESRFSAFLETGVREGSQVVAGGGVETALLQLAGQWRRLREAAEPGLESLLPTPDARIETLAPSRRRSRSRPVPAFV